MNLLENVFETDFMSAVNLNDGGLGFEDEICQILGFGKSRQNLKQI